MAEVDFARLPPPPRLHPVPVLATSRLIYLTILSLSPLLFRLALIPLLVLFALTFLTDLLAPESPLVLMIGGVNLFFTVWYGTAVQRLYLLGPTPQTLDVRPLWKPAQVRVFLRAIGIICIIIAAMVPPMMLFGGFAGAYGGGGPQIGTWMIAPMLVGLAAAALVCFTLPAAAVGSGYGFLRSARESGGILLSLIGVMLIVVAPADIVLLLVRLAAAELEVATGLFAPALILSLLAVFIQTSVTALALAVVFAARIGWQRPSTLPQGPRA